MKTVFVTGANSFTGRYLVPALDDHGWRVVQGIQGAPVGTNEVACNLEDRKELARSLETTQPDAIIHLAGISFVAHEDPAQIYQTNVIGTLNLLGAVGDAGIELKRFLVASSAAVYGNLDARALDESMCPMPTTDYGISKLACERIALQWSDRTSVLILRLFNYTGVGQVEHFVVPKIVAAFRRDEPVLELGNRDVVREYNDVRAISDIYCRLLEASNAQPIVNVCSGAGHTLDEVIAILKEISGHSPRIRTSPDYVRSNEIRSLVGDKSRLSSMIPNVEFPRLLETLGWMYEGLDRVSR